MVKCVPVRLVLMRLSVGLNYILCDCFMLRQILTCPLAPISGGLERLMWMSVSLSHMSLAEQCIDY